MSGKDGMHGGKTRNGVLLPLLSPPVRSPCGLSFETLVGVEITECDVGDGSGELVECSWQGGLGVRG